MELCNMEALLRHPMSDNLGPDNLSGSGTFLGEDCQKAVVGGEIAKFAVSVGGKPRHRPASSPGRRGEPQQGGSSSCKSITPRCIGSSSGSAPTAKRGCATAGLTTGRRS